MAATVVLNVDVNDAQALAKLNNLDSVLKGLDGKKHVITLDIKNAGQIQNLTKDVLAYAKAQAQAAKAEAELEKYRSRASIANARAAQEQAKSRDTATNLANANAKLASAQNRVSVEQERTAQTANRLATEQEKTARATTNAASAASAASSGFSILGGAVASALGYLASRAIHLALQKVTQGIREALTEMKKVDTELTNISKVSGKTGKELEAIGDAAYETATKYGVAASEYLSAVYDMQKAGMGDQSEAMGELAVKTMLVGDTTKDVASKFLLSANAAWKLEGNMESLSKIVDEADYINNNYATNLDKLASGMPIVASVAAQAGMSAEETMAALGTITHVTQESGTKAATALRALILNISGQVGKFVTEEGEEFEVTEKSVKSLQGLLEKYAKTEMDAAKAAGELVNPMTAIQALFKGMAKSDLNDVELFNLLSGMGGKLRTNQLTALVRNYELFDEMLGKIGNSAGTADKEISLMMQAWERKTQKLKNTWTKFVADIVSTDFIKGGIDKLTGFVDGLDDVLNKTKDPLYESDQTNKEIESTEDKIKSLQGQLDDLKKGEGTYDQIHALEVELELQEKILETKKLQYQLERKEGIGKLQEDLTKKISPSSGVTLDQYNAKNILSATEGVEFNGNIGDYKASVAEITALYRDYYDNVIKVRDAGETLTDSQKQFIETFEGLDRITTTQGLHVSDLVGDYWRLVDAQGNVVVYAKDIGDEQAAAQEASERELVGSQEVIDGLIKKYVEYQDAIDASKQTEGASAEEQAAALERVNETRAEYIDALGQATDAEKDALGEFMKEREAAALNKDLEDLVNHIRNAVSAEEDVASAAGDIEFSSAINSANLLTGALQGAAAAAAGIQVNIGHAAEGTKNSPGGMTLVNELGPELISENGHAYIANGGLPGIVNLSRGAIVLTADETKNALLNRSGRTQSMNAASGGSKPLTTGGGGGPSITDIQAAMIAAQTAGKGTQNVITSIMRGDSEIVATLKGKGKGGKGKGSGSGGDGGGASAKSVEDLAKETKDILSNIEKQAKLADNRKQYDKEVSLWEKGQREIDKMVAQYKKAGYKETDDEVLDLLNKRFDYEKKREAASKKAIEEAASELKDKLGNIDKQAKLADTNGDYEKEVRFYETAQEAIKEMVEKYRAAGYADDSDEILDLLQKNVDYGEKQVKIYKDRWNALIDALDADTEAQEAANALAEKEQALADAREALANASKQRTVRTYNAATGQWEWVADQSKVKSAQETLTKAEENYAKEVKDQAINELERLRDTMADLNDVILGPALSAIMSQVESSDTFQNFARALNGVYGVGSFLASTEGSSKVLSTADSHDTIYTFGNVTLTEEEASSMSVAQLAQRLQVLKIS